MPPQNNSREGEGFQRLKGQTTLMKTLSLAWQLLGAFFLTAGFGLAATTPDSPAPSATASPATAGDKINVGVIYAEGAQGNDNDDYREKAMALPADTTAIEAVNRMGLGGRLTHSARLIIWPNPAPKNKDDADPAIVEVGAVWDKKDKDVVLVGGVDGELVRIKITYGDFDFTGGNLNSFLDKLREQFGVDWHGVVVIPPELRNVRVPEFRKEAEGGVYDLSTNPKEVIALYNSIAKRIPAMGQWSWEGSIYQPQFAMLVADKSAVAPAATLMVKAMPIAGLPVKKWEELQHSIRNAGDEADAYLQDKSATGPNMEGRISIQAASKILVIIGTPAYIQMVESIVEAFEKNQEVENNPPAPGTAPGKTPTQP